MSATFAPSQQVVEPVRTRAATAAPTAAPAEVEAPRERSRGERIMQQVASMLSLALLLIVGFAGYLYGLSGLSEQRAQANLHKTFSYALGQALAPIGPTTEGAPVAVIDVPEIGLHSAVVVEGTSARDLTNGPGHRADSPLPGQAGVSVLYGRRVAFGGPFEHLMRLEVGDRISVTTGQGVAVYKVSSFGDTAHPAPANSANRLVLATADTAGIPHSAVTVSADLVSKVQPSSGNLPIVPDTQKGLVTDPGASLVTTLLWSQALLALAVIVTYAAQRWSRTATYLAAAPVALGVLWNLYENAACLLPNLY